MIINKFYTISTLTLRLVLSWGTTAGTDPQLGIIPVRVIFT
jgi:hypothetical protein